MTRSAVRTANRLIRLSAAAALSLLAGEALAQAPVPHGHQWIVPGLSILYYAGDGLFCYSHDYLNMTYVGETMKAMAWRPPAEFNMPPRKPNWSTDLPVAWRSLPDAFASEGKHQP